MATFRPPKRRPKKRKNSKPPKRKQAKPTKRKKPETYLQKLNRQAKQEKEEQRKRHRKIKAERDPKTGRFLKAKSPPRKQSNKAVRKALAEGNIPPPSRAAKLKRSDARKGEMNRYVWRFTGHEGIELALDLLKRLHENAGETDNADLLARIGVEAGPLMFGTKYKPPLRAKTEFQKLLKAYQQRLDETGVINFKVIVYALSYMKLDFM